MFDFFKIFKGDANKKGDTDNIASPETAASHEQDAQEEEVCNPVQEPVTETGSEQPQTEQENVEPLIQEAQPEVQPEENPASEIREEQPRFETPAPEYVQEQPQTEQENVEPLKEEAQPEVQPEIKPEEIQTEMSGEDAKAIELQQESELQEEQPEAFEPQSAGETEAVQTSAEEISLPVEQTEEMPKEEEHKSFWKLSFENLKRTISNTAQNLVGNVVSAIEEEEEFDDFILDDMEELLIKADLGVNLASSITDKLRKQTKIKPSVIKGFLKDEFTEILKSAGSNELNHKDGLNIFLVTGVNGAGKTTLIAKLANKLKLSGKRVLLAAGDTFRAAAEEQLDIWAQRAGVDIVRKDGIDAAAVVFDAIKKAQNENYDYVIIDTAGRLQNKRNLMEELNKIKNVIDKTAPGCLTESMLVLDANTGQNGLSQAKLFTESVNLTSVALTKLDGSAKGGIIIAIAKEFGLPVKLVGVGEKIDDLKAFDASDFINALFEK